MLNNITINIVIDETQQNKTIQKMETEEQQQQFKENVTLLKQDDFATTLLDKFNANITEIETIT